MTVAMLRLADEIGGQILIDGVSHASMTHEQLRAKLAIIPQEATMFAGALLKAVGVPSRVFHGFHALSVCRLNLPVISQDRCASTWTRSISSVTLRYTACSTRWNSPMWLPGRAG